MQVILIDRVEGLGQLGDVVKVKDGYARNFLIPSGKARRATSAALVEFEARRAELERVQAEKTAAAQALADRINGAALQIVANAGPDGRLFGSVTNADIAEGLAKYGVEIERGTIRMPDGPLKTVGEFKLEVGIYANITAEITVTVVAEG
ncbi:MAG: 50S ribosomal protein L9 [Burkholderiaceae bacterium]|nr:50S ribosomal protein L9 [Burkholderiaceae bacterium]